MPSQGFHGHNRILDAPEGVDEKVVIRDDLFFPPDGPSFARMSTEDDNGRRSQTQHRFSFQGTNGYKWGIRSEKRYARGSSFKFEPKPSPRIVEKSHKLAERGESSGCDMSLR